MKVFLVQSYLGGAEPPVFPLGLACVKAGLAGHDVRGLDLNTSKRPLDEMAEAIRSFSPDVVGISLRNIDSTNKREVVFYYDYFKKAIEKIKEASKARIVVGGSGFSMFARPIMEDEPGIEFGVFLEGEVTFKKLLDNLDDPDRVKGIFYRRSGKVVFTGAPPQVDLDGVEPPDRSMNHVSDYRDIPEAVGIETKRGCALKCVYCIYGFLNGRKYRFRSPEKIVDEIEALQKVHGIDSFTFVDSVFNVPQKHAEEICREIIKRGIKVKWSAWFSEKNITREFVELAREAGCKKVILSPDGFSDRVLKALEKNIAKKDIVESYKLLSNMDGFEICYNFFKNPPGQTLGAFLAVIFFTIRGKLRLKGRIHFEFNSMRVEPNTKLYDIAVSEGVIKKGEPLLYPRYYTNPGTAYIDKIFNLMLKLKGK